MPASHALQSPDNASETPDFRALRAVDFARAVAPAPRLAEFFADDIRDAAATGFILAQIGDSLRSGTLLWVQDRLCLRDHGRPYPHWRQAPSSGGLVHVVARDTSGALWAMEEGLRCGELSAVIGEIAGNPRALDFTATRRLAVAAERHGVPAFLLRLRAHADLSGARMRWRTASRPSPPPRWNPQAPGDPVWSLALFRARGHQPGRWEAVHESPGNGWSADRLDLVSAPGDPALGEGESRTG